MVKNKKISLGFLIAFVFGISFSGEAQVFKFWVKFKDKNGTPYSISNPSAYLSPKSIQRRVNQGIPIHYTDLPVTPSYATQVDAVPSVTVYYRSKWLNGVVVACPNSATAAINSFSFVSSTGPVNKYKIILPETTPLDQVVTQQAKAAGTATYNYAQSDWQQKMLQVECLHNLGFRGQNITIAVIDAGFKDVNLSPIYDSLFLQNRLLGTRDFVKGDTMVFEDDAHGAMCLSTMAGIYPGKIIGTAPKAKYWLLRSEDVATETISEEYNWIRAAEFADSVGADICSTSLGYTTFDNGLNDHTFANLDGKTSPMSIAATWAARKGMLCFNAAGNGNGSSWPLIGMPADADSICTVGAVDSLSVITGFSSLGPTADGRIKPDLCARGGKAFVCSSWPSCFFGNGTSFATPILAGAAASLWSSKPWVKNIPLLNAMKSSATNSSTPNNTYGWGIPKLCVANSSTVFTVGMDNNTLDHNISVYPNPFNDELIVNFESKTFSEVSIVIYDVLGKVVYSDKIIPKESFVRINTPSRLSDGFYYINVSSSAFSVSKKILKQ